MKKLGKKMNVTPRSVHAYGECSFEFCKAGITCSCSGTPSTEYNYNWNYKVTTMLGGVHDKHS